MLIKLILVQIILNIECIICVNVNDCDVFDKLYQKFQIKIQSESELKALKELNHINEGINQFKNKINNKINNKDFNIEVPEEEIFQFITETIMKILKVVDIGYLYTTIKEGICTSISCLTCHAMVSLTINPMYDMDKIASVMTQICSLLKLSTLDVCGGYIDLFKSQIDYIRHNMQLKSAEICGILMGSQCYVGESKNIYWELEIPKYVRTKNTIGAKRSKRVYKILHITDIHLDLEYFPVKNLECDTPYCCRKQGNEIEPELNNSYWGLYPCDIPLQTMDNAFQRIPWDYIDWTYWTGDITPHDSWRDTKIKSIQTSKIIDMYFKRYSKKLVVTAIGNHITVPVGSYPPSSIISNFSISWLYNELADQWSQWLPKQALDSLRYGGYYSLQIKPKFKVIVVNTNYCARLNIWTYYAPQDLGEQLQWLIQELLAAEKAGNYVHIVGHIPPDNRECSQAWLYNYIAIVERFNDIILGQFYGHTHFDEFRVIYSNRNISKPIGLQIVSPSLTTWQELNPAYRIILCKNTGHIEEIDTYSFDLLEANQYPGAEPNWYHEYSMSVVYPITQFNPLEFDRLIHSIKTDNTFVQTFYSYYNRFSSYANIICNNECKSKISNDIVISNPYLTKPKSIFQIINTLN